MDDDECDDILSKDEAFFSQIDEDLDYAFALSLQAEYNENSIVSNNSYEKSSKSFQNSNEGSQSSSKPLGIVDEQWELIDPNPDIHALFLQYNTQFFYGKLDGVEVKWSKRMTLCAGVCSYEGGGGLCSVRLSLPLLKLRPRRDLVETLLHEMIHAYLFVTANNKDHDAHGPEFLKHMSRINKETGTRISVYHSFHNEVDVYRKHVWKCNGPCQTRRPFFGLVKRASNRAPSPRDFWWAQHQSSCGGTFIKIKEPEDYKKKGTKRKPVKDANNNSSSSMKKFLKSPLSDEVSKSAVFTGRKDLIVSDDSVKSLLSEDDNVVNVLSNNSLISPSSSKNMTCTVPFSGQGHLLGSASETKPKSFLASIRQELASARMKETSQDTSQKKLPENSHHLKSDCPKEKEIKKKERKRNQKKLPENSDHFKSDNLPSLTEASVKVKAENASFSKVSAPTVFAKKKKNSSFVQSSMDKFVTSPSRSQGEKQEQSQSNSNNQVECPVCLQMFLNSEINAHLDSCLIK